MELYTIQVPKFRKCKPLGIIFVDTTVKSGVLALAPTWEMVMRHKKGLMTDEEYIEKYDVLIKKSQEDQPELWSDLANHDKLALGCYCRQGNFCHRVLLIGYFKKYCEENNIEFTYKGEIT